MPRTTPGVRIRVLCVDNDPYLTDLVRYALTRDGYTVEVANTGADALRRAQADPHDIVVFDLHVPDGDGFAVCGQIRKTLHIPVILVSASSTEAEVIKGYEHGADDYIAKPFTMEILSYRIRAVLRRRTSSDQLVGPIQIIYHLGSGTFHAEQHEVVGALARVKLTPIQGKMLRLLLENEGRVVSAEQLITKVWPFETESDMSVVKTHLSNLRKKLAAALGDEEIIHTVSGIGYTVRLPPGMQRQAGI